MGQGSLFENHDGHRPGTPAPKKKPRRHGGHQGKGSPRAGGGKGGSGGRGGGGGGGGGGGKIRHEHSAGFILYRDTPEGRKYLLLDYGRHWDYAKGHLEEGESPWKAAVRELREETGIRQVDRWGKFQRDMEYWFYSPKKGRVHKTVTYFVGKTRQDQVKVSEEHCGFAWLGYQESLERLTFENAREMLRAAEASLVSSR